MMNFNNMNFKKENQLDNLKNSQQLFVDDFFKPDDFNAQAINCYQNYEKIEWKRPRVNRLDNK